ncbi:Mov34/MPN/PAD-1 family protein [Pirellula staleyi DSM 6068]|uniref:Mov34/MPN/PAD-1 family protein n=1 Tax=Pirellula staleyi (strain ATCC 27377 / DSM 6068 / ICPB 4128) TaxID=530564 RepID=D2R364_PIRSD|nr:Mov34/MPN/PAD-1 family protein [Pirellula staleyi]ADB18797.1 Mov34/MPN/PAD-1 family protein [Pirellula staleyi DSM 6068]
MPSVPTTDTFSLGDLQSPRSVGTVYLSSAAIVLPQNVLDEIIAFSEQDLRRERGGFLLGGVYGTKPMLVVIKHFHPAAEAKSRAASLVFTHDTWAELHREAELKYPGLSIVGWHHTHPDFGIFLSSYDKFIHHNFFPQPWHVAMVVDPRRKELGFFHWRDRQIEPCGFVTGRLA